MAPTYYIQLEDKNIPEGNDSNTLFGLKYNFKSNKNVLVFSNHASEIKEKYEHSGMPTTIYNSENYSIANFASVLKTLKEKFAFKESYLIIFDSSNIGNSLGARLAAMLDTSFVANAENIQECDNNICVDKKIGKTEGSYKISLESKAIISTACNGTLEDEKNDVKIINLTLNYKSNIKYISEKNSNNDLAYAKVVVAGGKGLNSAENFKPLQILATKLNASLGATKAVTDQGWVDESKMIGISNLKIAPQVYYAFGISGAVQHTIGMNKSRYVIAVNTDASAPIFKLADYGIIGDANLVIKQLNNLL
ncbi:MULTISPECIES: electron transfer flavoprotein subunit alpha/FixB family protein [unclassified Lactobacillus]|uniref:electron transfer flavoprotein subunit alpha/FixB family protein n=1 Tax=unclassified Lactobacillus TaxID=2620435 RepID=UPI000EFD18FD|nr:MULTISPECIES: electron transfer flavoprotein subunit alpha/FixB family protein [unclassified Lactobacillus]RMC25997.1 electron transfer flavoprotein subunit alpha/FixB family protein [Lactobacillus sp. ESL0247]RMC29690.1 electron transfer flavoprotein subunit alpha/FixB family protein [Lactobacillus sp. ESL0246]RMC34095.1 electron transfer flavoprotein subunit alpha/FixB family protein [Lactobacillus sp. ESL0245]